MSDATFDPRLYTLPWPYAVLVSMALALMAFALAAFAPSAFSSTASAPSTSVAPAPASSGLDRPVSGWQRPGWIADPKTGCRVWNANPGPYKSIAWSGACTDALAHGRGVLQWFKNGQPTDRYEGDMRYGKQQGRGTMKTASGLRYDGEWQDGKASGTGKLERNGTVASGAWINGCFRANGRREAMGASREECGFQ